MEKDFDIEIETEETESEESLVKLPQNFLLFGEIAEDDVRVYIKQDVYKELLKYAASDTSKELGTILLGDFCEEYGKTHVVISDYITAKYTEASASTLTFTHKTWDYVHEQHAARCPDKKIIGWQHTHPSYGIFLSNYDLFIQENFFNLPFQVAYVIDPVQNLRGFFQWKGGKIEKLKGYYVYDDVEKPIKIEQVKRVKEKSAPGKGMTVLVSLLCVLTIGLGAYSLNISEKYKARLAIEEELTAKLETQAESIASLENQLIGDFVSSEGGTSAEELILRIENNEITPKNRDKVLGELKTIVFDAENGRTVRFVSYTVQSGDTLEGICKEQEIDYGSNKNIILAINGIENPNSILVGQAIVLPMK